MSRADRPEADSRAGFGAALEQAALAVHHAAFDYADRRCAPDLATARAHSWRLLHLLGALSDLTAALAAHLSDGPHRNQVRSDYSVEPAQHLAHACRGLADHRRSVLTVCPPKPAIGAS